MFPVVGMVFAF